MNIKKCVACILLLSALLSLAGCGASGPGSEPTPMTAVTPEPEITAEPAPLLCGVETQSKVVSLIFEGFTDSDNMSDLLDILSSRDVPAVFFISGVAANENPEFMRKLVKSGFSVGSYGLRGDKHLDTLSAYENARRFEAAQREIAAACGRTPEYVRCNGTAYTEDVLRAVTAAGLKGAVEPTSYLNHSSFCSEEEAAVFVQNVIRGSILSVKLGQSLDAEEYGEPGQKLDVRPAIDPTPGIRWDWDEDPNNALLTDLVTWLVDALKDAGYSFTDPAQLQQEAQTLLPKLRSLSDEEQRELNPNLYAFPVTEAPLYAGEVRAAEPGDFSGAVFVGDAVMAGLEDYVNWRRETQPDYLDDARFLTEDRLTVEALLNGESELGDLGARLAEMEAKSVWLCLGFANKNAFRRSAHLAEYRLLIHQIREQNPDIRVVVMPVLPKSERFPGISNEDRFQLDLMLCGMCREYGLPFLDIASAVRDRLGALREDYCLNPTTRGNRLNDAGCEAVADFMKENYPQ